MEDSQVFPDTITDADLKYRTGSQGWKQFLQGKKDIIAKYDSAKNKANAHEVATFHGNVAEALLRQWLTTFLPRRFGVTSGFIVSPDPCKGQKLPHFDVIIYDQLESPVLWLDHNPDVSEQGTSQAIPVEYVKGVLEVKSRWTPENAKEAIKHLHDLDELMQQNILTDPYKKFLSHEFFCGVVFFEVLESDKHRYSALNNLLDVNLRGYIGGVVFRGEGIPLELTGRIKMLPTLDHSCKSEIGKGKSSLLSPDEFPFSNSIEIGENLHRVIGLQWLGASSLSERRRKG
jgi:hypothetical protein